MKRRSTSIFLLVMLALDVAMINLSMIAAYYIRFRTSLLPAPQELHRLSDYAGLAAVESILFPLLLAAQRGYRLSRSPSRLDEISRVFTVVSIGTMITMAIGAFVSRDFDYSRAMLSIAWMLAIIFIVVARWVQYGVHSWLRARGVGKEGVLIVGTGEMAKAIRQRIDRAPQLGYRVVGFVRGPGSSPLPGSGDSPEVLGAVEEIGDIVRQSRAAEVIVAEPSLSNREIMDIVSKCEKEHVNIKVFPDVFQIVASEAAIGDLDGLPMVSVRDTALRGWNLRIKRLTDIVISGAALILFSPLMLAIALLIKLTSPQSPVFYVQERVGLDGKHFQVIKFRSMRPDAEEESGPVWARKGDPRTTRLGAILRRFSLDEMPQFINVFLGEMSLVGPRPERPVFVEQFSQRVPRYVERHKEKAGLTGWAQIHGLRGNVSIEERTAYDLWYVENWTFWLDLKILLLTIVAIIKGENAY
jgi:exopolysaccharide biosynthesis polyprenyl glycosylphosphotransferase